MKKLSVNFTKAELIFGWIYMVLEFVVLPVIFVFGNELLGNPMTVTELSFCIYAISFICTTVIFRKFLIGNLKRFFDRPGRNLGFGALAFVAYWVLSFAVSAIIVLVYPEFYNVNDTAISDMVQENFVLMSISTVILVPIAEELFFRGLLFRAVYNRSRILAYLISAIAFSLPHVVGYIGLYSPLHLVLCFVQYLPAGLCLSWAYAKTDSIFTPVLIHTVINLIGTLAMR